MNLSNVWGTKPVSKSPGPEATTKGQRCMASNDLGWPEVLNLWPWPIYSVTFHLGMIEPQKTEIYICLFCFLFLFLVFISRNIYCIYKWWLITYICFPSSKNNLWPLVSMIYLYLKKEDFCVSFELFEVNLILSCLFVSVSFSIKSCY